MSKKRRKRCYRNCCCCCGCGSKSGDPNDPNSGNYSIDPCVFNAMQQNQQFFFWLLIYSIFTNNCINSNILCKHDKLENYLVCSHEKLLDNAINT